MADRDRGAARGRPRRLRARPGRDRRRARRGVRALGRETDLHRPALDRPARRALAGALGPKRVIPWYTNRPRQVAHAVRRWAEAIGAGDLSHDGDETLAEHVGNAVRRPVNVRDDDGRRLWTIGKDRRHSGNKIDACMAAIISWEARRDALEAGERARKHYRTFGSEMGRLRGFLAVCPTPGCPELDEAGGMCAGCEAERQRRVDARRPSSRDVATASAGAPWPAPTSTNIRSASAGPTAARTAAAGRPGKSTTSTGWGRTGRAATTRPTCRRSRSSVTRARPCASRAGSGGSGNDAAPLAGELPDDVRAGATRDSAAGGRHGSSRLCVLLLVGARDVRGGAAGVPGARLRFAEGYATGCRNSAQPGHALMVTMQPGMLPAISLNSADSAPQRSHSFGQRFTPS